MRERQPPADLQAGREVRLETRHREAGEADEGRPAPHLQRPQAAAVLPEMRGDALGQGIALGPLQALRQKLRDPRVGIERGERRQVLLAPRAQDQTLGREGGNGGVGCHESRQ
jgi:hypothetical protein